MKNSPSYFEASRRRLAPQNPSLNAALHKASQDGAPVEIIRKLVTAWSIPYAAEVIAESWFRVVEGSGQRHQITSRGSLLVTEEFV